MLALEDEPATHFLRNVSARWAQPKAIIVASAHFETDRPTLTGSARPETIHDFHGFPDALYALRYNAPGSPELATRLQTILGDVGIKAEIDPARGFDHGAWNPLLLMYPKADIPVVELSIQPHRDAKWHYTIGQALAPLRAENILIMGTGNLTHNLREAFRGQHKNVPQWVRGFAEWIAEQVKTHNVDALLDWQTRAPYARENHPTPEHFLPFFVALGAGQKNKAEHLFSNVSLGVLAMDAYAFGAGQA
jgi:4,5-DOPA dioxygenase extradiol